MLKIKIIEGSEGGISHVRHSAKVLRKETGLRTIRRQWNCSRVKGKVAGDYTGLTARATLSEMENHWKV